MRQTMRPPLPLVIWLFHSTSPEGNLTYCIPVTTSIALKISQCHNIVFKISLWLFIGQHLNDLCSVWSTFNVQCWQLAICWECTCRQVPFLLGSGPWISSRPWASCSCSPMTSVARLWIRGQSWWRSMVMLRSKHDWVIFESNYSITMEQMVYWFYHFVGCTFALVKHEIHEFHGFQSMYIVYMIILYIYIYIFIRTSTCTHTHISSQIINCCKWQWSYACARSFWKSICGKRQGRGRPRHK